jgi:predicted transcriptional regulator
MDNILDEIKALQAKKDKAQTLLTRYKTQLETIIEERSEWTEKLGTLYGTTIDKAPEKLAELKQNRDRLLEAAKKALDKISL